MVFRSIHGFVLAASLWCSPALVLGGENVKYASALDSITSTDLRQHAATLANDTFEGREAGSRGGRAAAGYLQLQFQRYGLKPAGDRGTFYQVFNGSSRNILGMLEGSDPELAKQVILISAHFDHVGYGNASNSNGPTGFIHNGADDNASGTSTLLEIAEACSRLDPKPKRSILFALWDGEEKGLLGSKHWLASPTISLANVRLMINMDMVGRLRSDKLEISGVRTGAGFRSLASRANALDPLELDFTWEIKDNSDHYPFFQRGVPILMAHTGLHSDYHRPSDDVEKLNIDGMRRIARFVFNIAVLAADELGLPKFRGSSRRESPWTRETFERPLPALPGRLGLFWDTTDTSAQGLRISRIVSDAPAAIAGMRAGDRLLTFAGQTLEHNSDLAAIVLTAQNPVTATIRRASEPQPREVTIQLRGQPTRLGFSWREDDAEPKSVKLLRVIPSSPAARAGLRLLDRIHAVNGQPFASGQDLLKLLADAPMPFELEIERNGSLRQVVVGSAAP